MLDGDGLLDADVDSLARDPAVDVLEDVQRRLGVARGRGLMQLVGRQHLAVGAALQLGQLGQRIKLTQTPVLGGQQPRSQRQRVAFEALARRAIDGVQPRLCRLHLPGFVWE